MGMLKMKSIRELNEKDLRDRVEQMKSELSKLQTENAKGTLRKETGKIRKVRNPHTNSYNSPTKGIIGISLTQMFPFSSIFAIETLID